MSWQISLHRSFSWLTVGLALRAGHLAADRTTIELSGETYVGGTWHGTSSPVPLSKHNVSAYRQICQHLGHAIQAVLHDGQPVRSSTPRDVDSGERSRLPSSRSAGSPSSHGCGDGEPGHTTREELETEKQSLTARLDVAMSVAEERHIEIQRLHESNDTTEQHLRELQATIQQRDAEALPCTQLVAEYGDRKRAMTVLLHGWERGLRTL
ncbi:hypothetical protein LTR70_010341 [Exophiala xenobiotica]|nr:hypothetical protein LTR70_010341 [Exophiala xenobiotica]